MNPLVSYDSDSEPETGGKKQKGLPGIVNYSEDEESEGEREEEQKASPSKRGKSADDSSPGGTSSHVVMPQASTVPQPVQVNVGTVSAREECREITETIPCDPTIEANITALLSMHGSGFVAAIRSKKEFNNPYTLEKVSEVYGMDTFGTCFRRDVIPEGEYYDALAVAQKQAYPTQ